jgi:hypothetical protein
VVGSRGGTPQTGSRAAAQVASRDCLRVHAEGKDIVKENQSQNDKHSEGNSTGKDRSGSHFRHHGGFWSPCLEPLDSLVPRLPTDEATKPPCFSGGLRPSRGQEPVRCSRLPAGLCRPKSTDMCTSRRKRVSRAGTINMCGRHDQTDVAQERNAKPRRATSTTVVLSEAWQARMAKEHLLKEPDIAARTPLRWICA